MARSSTTSDVFTAIAEAHRRDILDALFAGEKAVGTIMDGRRRLYRLEPARLRPFHEWMAKYEQAWNDRLDRVDDYLNELQHQGERQ